jgi:LPS-assembly protein
MNNLNKGKAKNILGWWSLPLLLLLTYHLQGYATFQSKTYFFAPTFIDTPPLVIKKNVDTAKSGLKKNKPETIKQPNMGDEKPRQVDSAYIPVTDTFNYKISKDTLSSPIVYHADDSMVIDVPNEKMYLYGKVSKVKYEDNNLSAPIIEYDNKTSLVSAYLKKDSAGKAIAYPYYNSADFQSVSDTIRFNMKNGKGITKGTYTKQGEMFVYGEKMKKFDTSVFYAYKTRFTTCNLDTPHFAFISKKAKFVNKKWAYTGPVHPEFEGVPLPISLPFGIFPLSQGRRSGLLAPSFTADEQRGLALENLGYYRVINQNWDVITRGTLYSYGSWKLDLNPRYYKRYRYQGNLQISLQNFHPLDAPKTITKSLIWSHSADTKARPGVTFSANVNIQSTKFNEQLANNAQRSFENQLGSTIGYTKTWKNKPYNISINANHNQNNRTRLTTLNLPDIAFTVSPQYPFRRAEPIGDYKWYENIGLGYNVSTKSTSSFYDTAGRIGIQLGKNLSYGAHHTVPISLSLPPLGAFQVSPSVSYDETWYQQKLIKRYNTTTKRIDTFSLQKGLYTARQMSFSIGLSTRLFGMFGFKQSSRVKAIRHEIRPQISMSYTPNFNARNYYTIQQDSTGKTAAFYKYEGNNVYGTVYNNGKFGGITFNLGNLLSMKLKSKGDTSSNADKKVNILDAFDFATSYNFLRDSIKLEPITVNARTNLFEKINISAGAIFQPYQTDINGLPINKLVIKDKFRLGNLTSANLSLQTSFKGGDKNRKTASEKVAQGNFTRDANTGDEYQREAAYIQNNPAEFADFEIPWNIDLSYTFTFTKSYVPNTKNTINQAVTFNASANLTPKWKIGGNGSYDFSTKQLGLLSMYLSRDLHCWQMAINITPIGRARSFSINISPKSPILRDLKINRTRSFSDF